MFEPLKTSDETVKDAQKTLLYGHHGWGKTTQAAHLQEHYGKTLILSGEAGLLSVSNVDIDYLPFTSWAGKSDPSNGVYSLKDLMMFMTNKEFRERGYKCVVLDSLTEASQMLTKEKFVEHKNNSNGFEKWSDIAGEMLGVVKQIRDLRMHVLVTALVTEQEDDNGRTEYWPMITGKNTQKQLAGIFDNVFCGVRASNETKDDKGQSQGVRVERYIVTEKYNGWQGKIRDPRRRVKPVERTGNIVDLFKRMEMTTAQFDALKPNKQQPKESKVNE